jgi:hypothetical protein
MITYPTIEANFVLDDSENPRFFQGESKKHYEIELRTNHVPPDTYAVTYLLHESYPIPVHEMRNKDDNFSLQITSFGDYEVKAKIRHLNGVDVTAVGLWRALRQKYQNMPNKTIEQALHDIETN